MKSYIQIVKDIIQKQIDKSSDFTLIKIENFTDPKLYLEICNSFNKNLQAQNINFIGKLSEEKYKYWVKNNYFTSILDTMNKNGFVSYDERLTKWRNIDFIDFNEDTLKNKDKRTVIFLMGTEAVEDQGGLEDFYSINPEVIEGFINKKYSYLFDVANISLTEEDAKAIDNIYSNLFKFAHKDLFNLSNFIDTLSTDITYLDLIKEIFNELYSWWNIPNIRGILSENDKLKMNKKIDIIEKAYKFSVRTTIAKFQTDKKLAKLETDAEAYYQKNGNELKKEFSDKFPDYNTFNEVIEDLKNYIKGIEIDSIKHKLFKCDFMEINKIMNFKTTGQSKSKSTPKIYGDPFRAIFLPILMELNELDCDEKSQLNKIEININKISLANTKSDKDENEELISKWKSMCRFLGGIEDLFNRFGNVNSEGEEVQATIFSETIDEKRVYTFNVDNTQELIKSGILKSSSQGEQKSKITIEYKIFSGEFGKEIDKYEYEWQVPETEIWIYTFNFLNGVFEELIQQEQFLPIGITNKLDSAFEVKNQEQFIYSVKDLEIEYKDMLEIFEDMTTESYIKVEQIGKQFIKFMNGINEVGLFGAIYDNLSNDFLALNYLNSFNEAIPYIVNDLKSDSNIDLANTFSKALLILNNSGIESKSLRGAMMTLYHPVMLEKIMDRYTYLANGFVEMFKEICESNKHEFNNKVIVNKFDRYDQLATITSGASMMIGDNNTFVKSELTYGFYSLYGQPKENYRSSTVKVDFEIEEDFSAIIQSNPISSYISKTIADYINTYPSKVDGINIGFINCNDYKLIITGLHDIIAKTEKLKIKFKINLFIYSDDYTCAGKNYLKYWLENKFTEDDQVTVKAYLKYLDTSNITNINQYFNKNVVDSDLIFINNILDIKEIYPEAMVNNHNDKKIENRYPSVYLPVPCGEERARKVCISQNQFECELNFAQLMTYVKSSISKDATYRVIKKVELTEKKESILEALHEKGNWIVMLDENIDTKILTLNPNKIIGFSTGNGYFGEINTAISTKETHLNDLKNFLKRRLKSKFNNWNANQIERAAENCISKAKYLDGSEILKAINPEDESINNYLAYMLTSEFENLFSNDYNEDYYIRKIISLDSHSHLFDSQLDLSKTKNISSRPDFILIEVPKEKNSIDNEEININIKIIECKVANENEDHISKAVMQVKEGYDRFNKIWDKYNLSVDKRFWFNQLYRILAYDNSNEKFNDSEYKNFITNKLNSINEGKFNIDFDAFIYTYWIDKDTADLHDEDYRDGDGYDICIKSFGRTSIKKLIIPEYTESEDNNLVVDEASATNDDEDGKEESVETKDSGKNVVSMATKKGNVNYDDSLSSHNNTNVVESGKNIEKNDDNGKKEKQLDEKRDESLIANEIIQLLDKSNPSIIEDEEESIKRKIQTLRNELEIRKIKIIPEDYIIGPDIVRIRVTLGTGIDFSQVEKHAENMKLWLGINERPYIFIADGFVNIDVVRAQRQMIKMGDILEKLNDIGEKYSNYRDKFYVLLGEDILGNPKVIDMSDSNSPHLLIAGQTGSGKSVLLNAMLASIMAIYEPDEVEIILVDPKQVELTIFEESPFTKNNHIATESHEAIQLLDELVNEMNRRYKMFRDNRVKNITDFNKRYPENKEKRILMVFDEYGAMIEESKDIRDKLEQAIKQLSQKARAAGIHMIICTQTPRADIITTTIRNNLTARIALKVADSTASSLIIDTKGSESLLGKGDMLVKTADTSNLIRTKSPYIDEMEILDIVDYLNSNK